MSSTPHFDFIRFRRDMRVSSAVSFGFPFAIYWNTLRVNSFAECFCRYCLSTSLCLYCSRLLLIASATV